MRAASPEPAVDEAPPEERPPLGSWKRMYLLVLAFLVVQIALYDLFTRVFQ